MSFTAPLDIAKRALQHLGQPTIGALTDSSPQATQIVFSYPMLRQAELRKAAWTFAARRAVLRARTSTTDRITFAAWAIGTTYAIGDVVQDSTGYLWLSVRAGNIGIVPGTGGVNPYWIAYFGPTVADNWVAGNYFPGDVVYKSPIVYMATPSQGTAVTTQDPAAGAPWHVIAGATVAAMVYIEPRGFSLYPSAAAATAAQRNVYDLPANFVRLAPQDLKVAATPRQLLTEGQQFNDFEIEDKQLYSANTSPMIFRFTSDVTDVSAMEPLFAELLALSLARETCMILTGNRELLTLLDRQYDDRAEDARTQALIEGGSSEQEPRPQPQQPAGQSRGA